MLWLAFSLALNLALICLYLRAREQVRRERERGQNRVLAHLASAEALAEANRLAAQSAAEALVEKMLDRQAVERAQLLDRIQAPTEAVYRSLHSAEDENWRAPRWDQDDEYWKTVGVSEEDDGNPG